MSDDSNNNSEDDDHRMKTRAEWDASKEACWQNYESVHFIGLLAGIPAPEVMRQMRNDFELLWQNDRAKLYDWLDERRTALDGWITDLENGDV